MLFTFILARMQGIPNILGSMKYVVAMFIRGFVGSVSMSVYYYALLKLPLSDMVSPCCSLTVCNKLHSESARYSASMYK